ncbi:hypothetical protein O3P69_003809 [Scylla paramamosain]|uniref:HD domain-containing protein n=1 Tax=Scylla paramamosain TaxID=85552 RepID=A0AAW0UGZ0_SCYPA
MSQRLCQVTCTAWQSCHFCLMMMMVLTETDEDKHQREVAAIESFRSLVGQKAGTEMYDLFMEYEEQKTKEAKVVKDLDKFDMILQAFEYETDQERPGTLEEFFKSTEGKFTHPKIIKLIEQLYKERGEKLKSY